MGKRQMKNIFCGLLVGLCVGGVSQAGSDEVPFSDSSRECMECHGSLHPGIVGDWQASRHGRMTPRQAMGVQGPARKISAGTVPEALRDVAVGCAECHTLRAESHGDSFEHNGYEVHVVVTPDDCAVCHTEEAKQYGGNIMAHARNNLIANKVYQDLERSIIGKPVRASGKTVFEAPDTATRQESCLYCHGTKVEVTGREVRETDLGEMEFPRLAGWPNQGVGRLNPDGSMGACTPCHTRHGFSIEMARKPETCRQCHVGPDVPAYKVYASSKHGNIYSAMKDRWDFTSVPWTIGKDFTAPTCAACHISLLVTEEGTVVSRRTHQMNDRLPWRIFGLIYAHPHPLKPDTSIIRNKDGLPLPTDFQGGFAARYLIDAEEAGRRRETMQQACLSCHAASWVNGHWERFEKTVGWTNDVTRTATDVMGLIWKEGLVQGLDAGGSPFDEAVERKWCDLWLFYANTIRFASAMAGGGDYGVFADGRYHLTRGVLELEDRLGLQAPGAREGKGGR